MTRKKILLFITLFVVLGTLSYLSYSVIVKAKEKKLTANRLQIIPEFQFEDLKSSTFTNASLQENKAAIFVYFNTECDYCQHEAQSISERLDEFTKVQFIFVSTEDIETIKQFSENHNLNHQPNITFVHDNTDIFSTKFGATAMPYLLIYDKDQQLIKKHKGQLNANGILKALIPAKAGI
jgi:thioredoxin-related protein